MEKYFKIGEISKLYHIGVDSLRYYEEIGVISPKRSDSGYRLYSVDDIWRLNVIRELRELGFGMEQIGEYLHCHTVASTLELLQKEQAAIEEKMETLRQMKANVEQRMKTICSAQNRPLYKIGLETYPPRRCFSIPEGYSNEHEMDVLIKRLLNIDQEHFYVIGNNQIGTVISRKDAQETGKLNYKSVFIIDEHGGQSLPGGRYLTVSYQGNYNQSAQWTERLMEYAKKHQLTPVGDILELLWIDIHTTSDVQEHITELQVRVEESESEGKNGSI